MSGPTHDGTGEAGGAGGSVDGIYVERLGVPTFPEVARLVSRSRREGRDCAVRFVDSSTTGLAMARLALRLGGARGDLGRPERLDFEFEGVRAPDGQIVGWRVIREDLAWALAGIASEPRFQAAAHPDPSAPALGAYLRKKAVGGARPEHTLQRALYLIGVAAWDLARREGRGRATLLLRRRAWWSVVERYAADRGVVVVAQGARPRRPQEALAAIAGGVAYAARGIYLRCLASWRAGTRASGAARRRRAARAPSPDAGHPEGPPLLAVEYYGHLNLDRHDLHSDLFFWQRSDLDPRGLLVHFRLPGHPLDADKAAELARHGIRAMALDPRATTTRETQVFEQRLFGPRSRVRPRPPELDRHVDSTWVREQYGSYRSDRAFWADLSERHGIGLYVSWYKYGAEHCAIADAIADAGGLTALYQRSFEGFPQPTNAVWADLFFAHSPEHARVEEGSGSRIPYHVAVGYLGDHRFELVADKAREIADGLRARGARRIIAFFDENSVDDARWMVGHRSMREDHAFLLERLLKDPGLGLVLKPKVPGTLRRRLGDASTLLDEARATGRCVVLEAGALQSSHPPALAALAADVAIGHLYSATAGIEAALAGTRTLLLNQEAWPASPLLDLPGGRVVFDDWASLWTGLEEHWAAEDGVPGFGLWGDALSRLDPFRDGRAAERMGDYLAWLLDGLASGATRDAVLESAAGRYAESWGSEYVTAVGPTGLADARTGHATGGSLTPAGS